MSSLRNTRHTVYLLASCFNKKGVPVQDQVSKGLYSGCTGDSMGSILTKILRLQILPRLHCRIEVKGIPRILVALNFPRSNCYSEILTPGRSSGALTD